MHKLFPHGELDRALDVGVENPERFEAIADEVIGKLDREDSDLEVSDPQSWRRGSTPVKTSFVQQFRADVDVIVPLGRKEEGQLARRIEFARRRLEATQRDPGATSRRLVRRADRKSVV